ADRPVRILEAGARATHRGRDRAHRFGLADDALADLVFHPQQLVALAFEHSLDRDSGPARDDLRDVIGGDRLLDERAACIRGFYHLQSFLELGNATIGKLAGALVFTAALRIGEFVARLVELGLELLGIRELVL